MSVPTFVKAGLAVLAIAGGVLAVGPSASAAQLSPDAGRSAPASHSAPVTTQAVVSCWGYAEFGWDGVDHADRWGEYCTIDGGGGFPVTRCRSRNGNGNIYDEVGDWVGPGTQWVGGICQPGDSLVQGWMVN